MAHFAGLDVSVKETSVCVVDDTGKVILEQKVPTEPADIIALLTSLGVTYGRIGVEAGPPSQMAGQCVDRERPAGDLRRDAAHEGSVDGAADQQDGPQRCARDRADDAGRAVQTGACEDAGGSRAAHAADQPQAAAAQAAGPGVRIARHAAELRFESRRRQWLSIRGAGPRARRGLSSAGG